METEASAPRVTVGMAVYNGAAYLDQALAGLVGQTYRNFTLHVSDNASEDESWQILEKWAARDDRIVLHRQTVNIGIVAPDLPTLASAAAVFNRIEVEWANRLFQPKITSSSNLLRSRLFRGADATLMVNAPKYPARSLPS